MNCLGTLESTDKLQSSPKDKDDNDVNISASELSALHFADCDDIHTCNHCQNETLDFGPRSPSVETVEDPETLPEQLRTKNETKGMRPPTLSFFRDKSNSLSQTFRNKRTSGPNRKQLSGHSFHALTNYNATNTNGDVFAKSKFFLPTPMACLPLGAYASPGRNSYLSRTLSLRLEKKRPSICPETNDPGKPPACPGSRSLETLVVSACV